MAHHVQRLEELGPVDIGRVITHPWQVRSLDVIIELIHRLREIESWRSYYDFQRRLVGGLLETERHFAHASRMAKRAHKGKPVDPPETGDWELDRLVYRRVGRQLRSVGDALAWRLFNFDRRVIVAVSRNESPGPMFGKEGLGREIGEVKHAWENEHAFALLHDATNCMRIGDVTKFMPGRADLVEIKKDPKKLGREQVERMERVVATINEGAPMLVDGQQVELLGTSQQFRTHLPDLRRGLDAARREGHISIRLGTGWVVSITALTIDRPMTEEEALAQIERQKTARDRAFSKAGLPDVKHHLRARRLDRLDLNPIAAPYAIYPFDPETCAMLTCDFLVYDSTMAWDRLSAGFEAHGFTTRCELPEEAGPMRPDMPVILASKDHYGVLLRASGIDQVLLELVEPRAYAAAVEEVAAAGRDVAAGVFTFSNEKATWR